MGSFKSPFVVLVASGLLALAGCGGSGTSGADPLAQQNDPVVATPAGSGAVTSYSMSLSTVGSSGSSTVGANSTVIATATLKDAEGNPVTEQPIRFEEVVAAPDGALSVTIPVPIVRTSSGVATTLMSTGNSTVNRDVIVKASTSINGSSISALSVFKIVRSTGNYIDFISTKETTDPDGNLNHITATISEDPVQTVSHSILQLAPFQVLDKNGLPRTHVPVTLSVYSVFGCQVVTDSPEPGAEFTVVTDNTGIGVFNSYMVLPTPPPGGSSSCSVIYKATTPDPYADDTVDLFSYGAYIVTLENEAAQ